MDSALVRKSALDFILEASKKAYPKEFTAQLRIEDGVITEVMVIPKSIYGQGFAVTRLDMMPIDASIKGSVHSHPSENAAPSAADKVFFSKHGEVHLIIRRPFNGLSDVSAYNSVSERIPLKVVEDE